MSEAERDVIWKVRIGQRTGARCQVQTPERGGRSDKRSDEVMGQGEAQDWSGQPMPKVS